MGQVEVILMFQMEGLALDLNVIHFLKNLLRKLIIIIPEQEIIKNQELIHL